MLLVEKTARTHWKKNQKNPVNKNSNTNNSNPNSNFIYNKNNINKNKAVTELKESQKLFTHPVRHVEKQTISQRNATLERMQLIDRLPGTEDQKMATTNTYWTSGFFALKLYEPAFSILISHLCFVQNGVILCFFFFSFRFRDF